MKAALLVSAVSLFTFTAYAADDIAPTNPSNTNPSPAASPASASATPEGIVGNYQCQRKEANNATSNYPLSITKTGDTYTFEWDDSNGNAAFYGTGIIHPSMANVVSVTFWDPKNPDTVGIETFEIKPDGAMSGTWNLQASNDINTETCTKGK